MTDRCVIVLGMHRSGTSVVTRVINLLGPVLCREDDLYTAPDNPSGHWESKSLVALNDRLLGILGGTFTAPPDMARGWESDPRITRLRGEARSAFDLAHPVAAAWVWKDPRTCLTLPFWRDVIRDSPVAVFVHREPLEVFLSLHRRDSLGKAHCLALWERYVRLGLQGAADLPFISIRFDQLVADPVTMVTRLRAHLAEAGVRVPAEVTEASRFVTGSQAAHRRPGFTLSDDPDATAAQRSLLAVVDALPQVSDCFPVLELGPESASTTELLSAVRTARADPAFGEAARAVWPAFRQSVRGRLTGTA
jgi:hypothetical protein